MGERALPWIRSSLSVIVKYWAGVLSIFFSFYDDVGCQKIKGARKKFSFKQRSALMNGRKRFVPTLIEEAAERNAAFDRQWPIAIERARALHAMTGCEVLLLFQIPDTRTDSWRCHLYASDAWKDSMNSQVAPMFGALAHRPSGATARRIEGDMAWSDYFCSSNTEQNFTELECKGQGACVDSYVIHKIESMREPQATTAAPPESLIAVKSSRLRTLARRRAGLVKWCFKIRSITGCEVLLVVHSQGDGRVQEQMLAYASPNIRPVACTEEALSSLRDATSNYHSNSSKRTLSHSLSYSQYNDSKALTTEDVDAEYLIYNLSATENFVSFDLGGRDYSIIFLLAQSKKRADEENAMQLENTQQIKKSRPDVTL
jgi:hypothetical protein